MAGFVENNSDSYVFKRQSHRVDLE